MDIGALIAGLPSNIFLILMVMAGIAIFLVIIIFLIKYLMETAPFAYVNARVRSMESRLLDEQKFNELIESAGMSEFIGFLEDTDYGEYIKDSSDMMSIEKALNTHLAHVYGALANMSPEKSRKILKLFEKKFDVQNIKILLRAKYVGLNAEETSKLIIPLGTISENKLRELCETKAVEEVVSGLEGTEYSKILSNEIATYEQTKKLGAFELSLDKYVLENLWKSVGIEGTVEDIFKEFVGAIIDIENLKIILKGKADGLPSETVLSYVLDAGYEIAPWKLKELADAESIEGVISSLEGTKYGSIISDKLEEYEKVNSVFIFEHALDKYLSEVGKKLSLRQPFGVGPIIGLIISKEQEIKNLKIITKGKMEGLNSSQIRELLNA
ncbi:ATPase, A1 complex, subunit C [Methanococcus aeolicus Nankai-3]|jgi:V/A-type H+-transporting ATPase subunit C|uniref:A-type ATP synthase subunit C n=1 Tax=Methanococcus aeolicus (strain ATCC BAA-1280 / DSM 17508 / OCM 812 / Nankai-3) TaxID=419665 RepID=A6UT33_META3|nr:V-type ATP synthase subunit C [Methanococcus aeolicus]ABR55655.1 ATPase, A1 complex, subunit C [Methanococcus aeolicus Nankai-3]